MKINVKLHPNSSQEKIVQLKKDEFEVWIREKPIMRKANSYLEKFLKKELKNNFKLVKGFKSRNKVFEVLGN